MHQLGVTTMRIYLRLIYIIMHFSLLVSIHLFRKNVYIWGIKNVSPTENEAVEISTDHPKMLIPTLTNHQQTKNRRQTGNQVVPKTTIMFLLFRRSGGPAPT